MLHPWAVLHTLSSVMLVFALSMAGPLLLSAALDDGARFAFEAGMLLAAVAGVALWAATRRARRELSVRDGFLLVAAGWTMLPALAAVPLLLYFHDLTFTKAYFETVSGLTTTGATVLVGLDALPPSINLWRCQLQWMGGMGIIVLAVAILPLLGVGGAQVVRAETPGPMKDNKLTPRIAETAKGLWTVYAALTLACIAAMKLAGMSWLDAIMHAFTTMSLGGLSSHDASFGYWNSVPIETVTIVFMFLSGMNFATHFLAMRDRSLRAYQSDPEAGPFVGVLVASVLIVSAFLWWHGTYPDWGNALRYAAFNVVSIATTTGYANTDYGLWPIFAPMWMLILCCFVTCSGSTGAGIKMVRARLMAQQALREMRRSLHPRAVLPIKLGGRVIENNVVFAVLAFMLVYGMSVTVVTMTLIATDMQFVTAFSAAIACINNMGPGLNEIGPAGNYAMLTPFQTWVCSATMLLGRLEMFTLIIVLTPGFWRT